MNDLFVFHCVCGTNFCACLAGAVSCRPFTEEARIRSRAALYEFRGEHWHLERFLSEYFGFGLFVSFCLYVTHVI
jgi:hypothetical protein